MSELTPEQREEQYRRCQEIARHFPLRHQLAQMGKELTAFAEHLLLSLQHDLDAIITAHETLSGSDKVFSPAEVRALLGKHLDQRLLRLRQENVRYHQAASGEGL